MQNENRHFLGPGYHVNHEVAKDFSDKYINDDGHLINMDSDEFKSDLESFLDAHSMVEESYRTVGTSKLFEDLRNEEGVF